MNRKLFGLLFALVCLAAVGQARYANINVSLGMTVSEDTHRLTDEMMRLCAEETDLSMAELTKFRRSELDGPLPPATKCFTHCLYEQMGLMRDGIFVPRDFIGMLSAVADPNYMAQRRCHGLQAENKCERAFKIHKCLKEAGHNFVEHHEKSHSQYPSNAAVGNSPVAPPMPVPRTPTGPLLPPVAPTASRMLPHEYSVEN